MTTEATLPASPKAETRPRYQLLVGSQAFWARAQADIAAAKDRVLVQAMTFEGDSAGLGVAQAIQASPARERRVLVDHYTRLIISDRPVRSLQRFTDRAFAAEIAATHRMFRELRAGGVGVRVTNPLGPWMSGRPFRNHKKIIVADQIAYIGGINFSDHNFEWPDLMLRIEDAAAANLLADDFLATYESRGRRWRATAGDLELHSLDGRSNAEGFQPLIERIEAAVSSIVVVSPYLTFPFFEALQRAVSRGAEVTLITPDANNKPFIRDYLLWAGARAGLQVRLTPGMMHLKGMLLDGRTLLLGSANFDFVSYLAEEEIVGVIDNAALASAFRREVVDPALAAALPAGARTPPAWSGPVSRLALRAVNRLIGASPWDRRGAEDWRY